MNTTARAGTARKATTGLIGGFISSSQAGIDYHVQVFVSDGDRVGTKLSKWPNILSPVTDCPSLSGTDLEGNEVDVTASVAGRWAVVLFYRGDW